MISNNKYWRINIRERLADADTGRIDSMHWRESEIHAYSSTKGAEHDGSAVSMVQHSNVRTITVSSQIPDVVPLDSLSQRLGYAVALLFGVINII